MESEYLLDLLKHHTYDSCLRSPIPWAGQALRLKRAADEIYGPNLTGFPQEHLACIPIYRFLLGLSIENLIKGLLIAHGQKAGHNGQISGDFKTHGCNKLLDRFKSTKCDKCVFTDQERGILSELERHVLWIGRYPVPLDVSDFRLDEDYSSGQYRHESELWERLFAHLKDLAKKAECHTADA